MPPQQIKRKRIPPDKHQYLGPHLIGQAGELSGQQVPIGPETVAIGRSRTNTVQLRERSVSRTHALVWLTTQGVYIRDEGSSLGTYVNGQRIIHPTRLRDQDIIQIGYHQVFEFKEK